MRVKTGNCQACGATLTLKKFELPYCKTQECATAYVPMLVESRTYARDGHLIWDGSFHSRTGRPICRVEYRTGDGNRELQYNPRDILYGRKSSRSESLERTCDEARCVAPHHSVLKKTQARRQLPAPKENPRLPVKPLAALIAAHGEHLTLSREDEEAIRWAHVSGQIDLYIADRICCDALGIHPYFVWGSTFYEVR